MTTPQSALRAPVRTEFSARQHDVDSYQSCAANSAQPVRSLYFALAKGQPESGTLHSSRRFLDVAIADVEELPCDLPTSADQLKQWIARGTDEVGQRYQAYLAARKAGGPRQYFCTKAHALNFLKSVAPTKTVDGAWLYGLTRHWNDGRFGNLIRIYLEELGSGMPDKNHVLLYRKLLASNGCEQWDRMSESHYVQGVIQLALAHNADRFLPEIIGFNLGYEQLPLHLLVTAYELNELGIDPYYFTLHVTVDNADTGHAMTALHGLRDAWPIVGDGKPFYERVMAGYKLNLLGASTNSVIDDFDLEQEVITILREKSEVGKQVHSDYCKVAGRAINDWLRDPAQIPAFLEALQKAGWICRNEAAENSRFWKLIQGERAEMFGVFSAYEQQVIHDWITGDAGASMEASTTAPTPRALGFKARQKLLEALARRGAAPSESPATALETPSSDPAGELLRGAAHLHAVDYQTEGGNTDFDHDLRQLDLAVARAGSKEEAMQLLVGLMSPARHHTPVGLKATRLFAQMLG